jgi:flagellar protein FliO/FliZ
MHHQMIRCFMALGITRGYDMFLAAPDKTDLLSNSIEQFMTVAIIFIFVVGISYFATRWLANYQKSKTVAGNIEVIETFRLTTNKFVQIIRVGEKYLAIAIGKDEVNVLTELTADDIKFKDASMNVMPDFAGILAKFKKQLPEKKISEDNTPKMHCDYEKKPPHKDGY